MYVVRFTTEDYNKLNIADYKKYPNTGNGFTAGTDNIMGVPELEFPEKQFFKCKEAAIYMKKADGTEEMVAILKGNKFIKVTN